MTKTNKYILLLAAFLFGSILLPSLSYAQMSAPGSSNTGGNNTGGTENGGNDSGNSGGKSPTVDEWLQKAQQEQQDRIDSSYGTDTGENYGIDDAAGDAIKETITDIQTGADNTWEAIKQGDIKGALTGALQTTGSIALSSIKSGLSFLSNLSISGDIYEYVDPSTGETIRFTRTIFGTAAATEGVMKGCPPIPIAIAEASNCIFCPLFAVLYGAAQEMASLSAAKLCKAMALVMFVGYALYIAFRVLAQVSSFTRQDAPKFINEMLIQSFKVLIAFLLLLYPDQIYKYFITPVLGAGLDFGTAMLFQASDMAQQCVSIKIENDTALLPVSLYAKLDCYIRAIQAEIGITQAIGSSLMCVGRKEASNLFGFWDWGMIIQGLVIWGFALMLSLAFAFYLIDATVTLGLVGALMPFLIACWPFKITSKYTKTGIDIFLNTFFTFVFMGIVISINMQLIGQAMNGTDSASGGEGSGLSQILEALSGNDIKKVQELTDIGFGGFLILLCCCIFGFKFTSQASTLANKMAGGAGMSIGAGIGGLATKGVTAAAKKATQPARKAVANKTKELTGRAGSAVAAKLGLGKHGGKTGSANTPMPTGGAGGNNGGGNRGSGGGNGSGTGGNGGTGGNNNPNPHTNPTGGQNLEDELHNQRSGAGGSNGGADGGNGGGSDDGEVSGNGGAGGGSQTQTQSSGPTGAGSNGGAGGGNGRGNGSAGGGNGGTGNQNPNNK